MQTKLLFLCLLGTNLLILYCSAKNSENFSVNRLEGRKGAEFVGGMIEQGRTLVHHAVKRFMIIGPAIFFKLGIAFTLLVLVALAAVNNGFIGLLLLVVGLSNLLARFQDSRRPAPLSPVYYVSSPPIGRFSDRSDTVADKSSAPLSSAGQYPAHYQYYANNRPYSAHSQAYGQQLS